MSQDLILGMPMPVALALLGMMLILLALASLVALRKLAPARIASHYNEAPYKIETPHALPPGRLDVVPHAGRDPANR
ncbi:hypothetical protein [Massilia sp. 9096]|uniref:hypothetical protein n=1 Tax=Massilia sp. 9096 TaxID=1500894 RepID=UPI00056CC415|nr:hypothetical protein [Massilia sp. 9096]